MQPEPRTPDLLAEIARLKAVIEELKTSKPYGLVWEDKPEQFEKDAENAVPVLATKGGKYKDVEIDPAADHHVLIEGDNYHALSVLSYSHRGKIDVIYIDPPYNTGNKTWRYNNDYVDKDDLFKHSKWLSFMHKRLQLARDLLSEDGALICAIDENEHAQLTVLLEQLFPRHEVHSVAVVHNPKGVQGNNFSYVHEYALFVIPKNTQSIKDRVLADEEIYVSNLRNWGSESLRTDARNCFFPIFIKNDQVVGFGDVPAASFHPKMANEKMRDGSVAVWPIDSKGVERKWRYARQSVEEIKNVLVVKSGDDGFQILIAKPYATQKTLWTDKRYDASEYGTKLLKRILPETSFDFPKSIHTVSDCITAIAALTSASTILDFFAGSGTTGHAVLELNKDGGNRRVILCTNNENGICEDVTYERMKRVMKGYTAPDGEKVPGLGGNLKYLKTAFVKKELPVGLSDEAKLELTRKANLIIGLRENAFTFVEANDHYEILSSPAKLVGIYFRENKEALTKMLDRMMALAGDKQGFAYVFSWEKGAYKTGFDGYPFTFEDIPEPLVEVYQSIGL